MSFPSKYFLINKVLFFENIDLCNYKRLFEEPFFNGTNYDNSHKCETTLISDNSNNTNNDDNNISNIIDIDENMPKKKEMEIITITTDNKTKKKKMGRKKEGEIYDENDVHGKNSQDNMESKFKKLFFNNKLIGCLNNKLSSSKNPKLKDLRFQKLNSAYINSLKKDLNLEMLGLPASEVMSKDIAKKIKMLPKDHNKKLVKLIYEVKEKAIINILDKSTRFLLKSFCGNSGDDSLLEGYRLCDCIDELRKKNSPEYIEKFIEEANNFEENLKKKIGRKRMPKIGT